MARNNFLRNSICPTYKLLHSEKAIQLPSEKFVMFDVKGVDIQIEILVLEDFNTIKDSYNLIQTVMQAIFHCVRKV